MNLLQTEQVTQMQKILAMLTEQATHWGLAIIKAILIFVIGRFLIKLINKLVKRILVKQSIDPAVQSFVASIVNVGLIILLGVTVIGALGIQTTSFAALIASVGLAMGMAFSGNLSNFAGGLIILLFKPFKVGDYISTADVQGTVSEIQIFHTILNTIDNVRIHIPNGTLSSGYINNYSTDKRRIDLTYGFDYGEDFEKVRKAILEIIAEEKRIFSDPAPFVEISSLGDSSVNALVRIWVKGSDYWNVTYAMNRLVYAKFNKEGIEFPFPQVTVSQRK